MSTSTSTLEFEEKLNIIYTHGKQKTNDIILNIFSIIYFTVSHRPTSTLKNAKLQFLNFETFPTIWFPGLFIAYC